MQKNRIEISPKLKKQLTQEFDKSSQAIQMSLDYVFNSDNAKKIRIRAKELLIEEANKISE